MMMAIHPAGGSCTLDKIEELYCKRFRQWAIPIHRGVIHQSGNMMGDHDRWRCTPGTQRIPEKSQPLVMQKRKILSGKFPALKSYCRKIRDASLKIPRANRAYPAP